MKHSGDLRHILNSSPMIDTDAIHDWVAGSFQGSGDFELAFDLASVGRSRALSTRPLLGLR